MVTMQQTLCVICFFVKTAPLLCYSEPFPTQEVP